MKVGSVRPELRRDWMEKNGLWKLLAHIERSAAWFFFLFNTVALFRLAIEGAAALAVIATIVGLYQDFEQRENDRAVRAATLLTQIAQTISLPDGREEHAVKASVELLARDYVPMDGIDLSGAELIDAKLSGASFVAARFIDTMLVGSELSSRQLLDHNRRYQGVRDAQRPDHPRDAWPGWKLRPALLLLTVGKGQNH